MEFPTTFPVKFTNKIYPDHKSKLIATQGGTRFTATQTESPWALQFDAIVIPVRSGASPGLDGRFAKALYRALDSASKELQTKFKDTMKSLPGGILRPENPQLIRLSSSDIPKNVKTHQYIIATAFDRNENPSVQNAKTAARAIVELAEEHQLERVAIVPLGSGAGGLPASEVYREMVAGFTERLPVDNIEEISFITISTKYLQELQSLFLKRPQSLRNDLARGEDLLGVASEGIVSKAAILGKRSVYTFGPTQGNLGSQTGDNALG